MTPVWSVARPNWASPEYATREQHRPSDHMTPRRLRPCRHPMHSGCMSNTQTTHRTHTTALRMCAYIAPLVAQCIMLAALLVRQQWLFALMIGSGCCATAATMVLTLLQSRPTSFDSGADGAHTPAHACDTINEDMVRACTGTTLERLLNMADDAAPFRTMCHMWARTACSTYPPGCAARIGTDPFGEPLTIDLERHGPHAIVAGTTGSGKSVLLQDWCVALAATHPPQALQFVLLDFKGGSAMERLCALPHVRGCVNDLDLKYATRALRALERELDRRERLAAALGVSDLMHAACPVARLVIVVDEFHMLHGQLPDYTDRLVRIASLGRSLGMHLVACTQNPLGQISASMKANMSLRICLRVRDALQSQEMIGSDAAAHLSAVAPGMAILMEDDERRVFRCAHIEDIDALIRNIARCGVRSHCPTHARRIISRSASSMTEWPSHRSSSTRAPVRSRWWASMGEAKARCCAGSSRQRRCTASPRSVPTTPTNCSIRCAWMPGPAHCVRSCVIRAHSPSSRSPPHDACAFPNIAHAGLFCPAANVRSIWPTAFPQTCSTRWTVRTCAHPGGRSISTPVWHSLCSSWPPVDAKNAQRHLNSLENP